VFIVGERINATRKRVGQAVENRDVGLIKDEALKQVEAGADMLDVNGGVAGGEIESLPWLVDLVQGVVDVPLCLDSPNPDALGKALPLCKLPPMINSISGEGDKLERLAPLAKEFDTKVIALCLTDGGPPKGVEDRLEIASQLVEGLTAFGVPMENIYIDPCVFPASTGGNAGPDALAAIRRITAEFPGAHTICGASNISYGLPFRKLINGAFLAMLMANGLDSAILDPCDKITNAMLMASRALLGQDQFCAKYVESFRAGKIEL
jgi:5-methyltetrahydrofolate--homocysteine methyltransferase